VLSATPQFQWLFLSDCASPQVTYEIELGTDSDWTIAESWTEQPLMASDTVVVYGGSPLVDGNDYSSASA